VLAEDGQAFLLVIRHPRRLMVRVVGRHVPVRVPGVGVAVQGLGCGSRSDPGSILMPFWTLLEPFDRYRAISSSSSLISSLLHSHVTLNLEWCDKIKLSNLLLPRKSGTIKSLQLLSTSGTLLALEQLGSRALGPPDVRTITFLGHLAVLGAVWTEPLPSEEEEEKKREPLKM